MYVRMFRSKIHRARITQANLEYEGSFSVDRDLMDAAGMLPHEEVQVVNLANGNRFTTYLIEGQRGSGVIGLNGAAARLGMPGDLVILITYGLFDREEARSHTPTVVHVDAENRVERVTHVESVEPA